PRIVERHRAEALRRALVTDPLERLPALEVLVPLHREAETGRDRVVLGPDVLAPQAVALLEPQGVERAEPRGDQTVFAPRLPQEVPDPRTHLERPEQLPAELADVADPLREDGHLADLDLPPGHVGDGVVADVGVGCGRKN